MKKLLALLIPAIIGWMLIGRIDKDVWDKLSTGEKKGVVNLMTDRYFQMSKCQGADFRIIIDNDVQFFAICTNPRKEV
jgi:hypothetical protein